MMIIPLEKLMSFQGNKYVFTRAAMIALEKKGNIKDYPEKEGDRKVVPHLLNILLTEKVKYARNNNNDE